MLHIEAQKNTIDDISKYHFSGIELGMLPIIASQISQHLADQFNSPIVDTIILDYDITRINNLIETLIQHASYN
jgi:hypothetical protein